MNSYANASMGLVMSPNTTNARAPLSGSGYNHSNNQTHGSFKGHQTQATTTGSSSAKNQMNLMMAGNNNQHQQNTHGHTNNASSSNGQSSGVHQQRSNSVPKQQFAQSSSSVTAAGNGQVGTRNSHTTVSSHFSMPRGTSATQGYQTSEPVQQAKEQSVERLKSCIQDLKKLATSKVKKGSSNVAGSSNHASASGYHRSSNNVSSQHYDQQQRYGHHNTNNANHNGHSRHENSHPNTSTGVSNNGAHMKHSYSSAANNNHQQNSHISSSGPSHARGSTAAGDHHQSTSYGSKKKSTNYDSHLNQQRTSHHGGQNREEDKKNQQKIASTLRKYIHDIEATATTSHISYKSSSYAAKQSQNNGGYEKPVSGKDSARKSSSTHRSQTQRHQSASGISNLNKGHTSGLTTGYTASNTRPSARESRPSPKAPKESSRYSQRAHSSKNMPTSSSTNHHHTNNGHNKNSNSIQLAEQSHGSVAASAAVRHSEKEFKSAAQNGQNYLGYTSTQYSDQLLGQSQMYAPQQQNNNYIGQGNGQQTTTSGGSNSNAVQANSGASRTDSRAKSQDRIGYNTNSLLMSNQHQTGSSGAGHISATGSSKQQRPSSSSYRPSSGKRDRPSANKTDRNNNYASQNQNAAASNSTFYPQQKQHQPDNNNIYGANQSQSSVMSGPQGRPSTDRHVSNPKSHNMPLSQQQSSQNVKDISKQSASFQAQQQQTQQPQVQMQQQQSTSSSQPQQALQNNQTRQSSQNTSFLERQFNNLDKKQTALTLSQQQQQQQAQQKQQQLLLNQQLQESECQQATQPIGSTIYSQQQANALTMGSLTNNQKTTTLMRTTQGGQCQTKSVMIISDDECCGIEDLHMAGVRAIQKAKKLLMVQEGGRPRSEEGNSVERNSNFGQSVTLCDAMGNKGDQVEIIGVDYCSKRPVFIGKNGLLINNANLTKAATSNKKQLQSQSGAAKKQR